MKGRFRFWGLYCGLILSFVLHYFATSQLKIYENHLWKLFDSPKATIIMYLGNGRVCESFSVNRILRSSMIKY